MRADEKAGKAVDRLSALLSLASRCETLQELDITWGHAMVKQLDHLLFVLRLQGLQLVPGGVDGTGGVTMRGAALRSFSLNECEVTVGFLQALPEVAPLLASYVLASDPQASSDVDASQISPRARYQASAGEKRSRQFRRRDLHRSSATTRPSVVDAGARKRDRDRNARRSA